MFTTITNELCEVKELFKYRDWKNSFHKKILTERQIYFANPSEFNDPFDTQLPYLFKESDITFEKALKRLMEDKLELNPTMDLTTAFHSSFPFLSNDSGLVNWKKRIEERVPLIKQEMNRDFSILSLTSNPENILMWSHYTNSYKGFCVGLNPTYFKPLKGKIEFKKVNYEKNFPSIDISNRANLIDLVITKSPEWEYEDEYRIIRYKADSKIVTLPTEAFTKVILGCRMDSKERDEIYKLCRKEFPKMDIFDLRMNDRTFGVHLVLLMDKLIIPGSSDKNNPLTMQHKLQIEGDKTEMNFWGHVLSDTVFFNAFYPQFDLYFSAYTVDEERMVSAIINFVFIQYFKKHIGGDEGIMSLFNELKRLGFSTEDNDSIETLINKYKSGDKFELILNRSIESYEPEWRLGKDFSASVIGNLEIYVKNLKQNPKVTHFYSHNEKGYTFEVFLGPSGRPVIIYTSRLQVPQLIIDQHSRQLGI